MRNQTYTVYIDESGDSGIKNVRSSKTPGSSQYLTLCATIVPNILRTKIEEEIDQILAHVGAKKAHATNMEHAQKVYCGRQISKMRVRMFGVVSNKLTLGSYAPYIGRDSNKFYNKCSEYLLEKLCGFLIENKIGPDSVSIIFEERNHDYSALLSYIKKIRRNPLHSEAKKLIAINPFSISFEKKQKEKCFFLSDFGANALYSCFNRSGHNYEIPETRYLQELRKVFHRDGKTKMICGTGIKFIQNLSDLQADEDVNEFLKTFSAN